MDTSRSQPQPRRSPGGDHHETLQAKTKTSKKDRYRKYYMHYLNQRETVVRLNMAPKEKNSVIQLPNIHRTTIKKYTASAPPKITTIIEGLESDASSTPLKALSPRKEFFQEVGEHDYYSTPMFSATDSARAHDKETFAQIVAENADKTTIKELLLKYENSKLKRNNERVQPVKRKQTKRCMFPDIKSMTSPSIDDDLSEDISLPRLQPAPYKHLLRLKL